MREKTDALPSKEESERETKKRLRILDSIMPDLKKFSEIIILAGSLAYGKNYSVRKESDIDLIVLINRKNIRKIFDSGYAELTPQMQEALEFFESGEVAHFSTVKKIEGISVQAHIWDKEAHFKAELMQDPNPKVYNVFRPDQSSFTSLDFSGQKRTLQLENVKRLKFGCIHIYPPYYVVEGHFVPKEPLLNLIAAPDILFCKDPTLLRNIDAIWKNLALRLLKESNGKIDLEKKSILKAIYGYWNMSKESREKLEKRQDLEIQKLK